VVSEVSSPYTSRGRTILLAAWIFGCAIYYYLRFTAAFIHENDAALRRAFPRATDAFLSQPADR